MARTACEGVPSWTKRSGSSLEPLTMGKIKNTDKSAVPSEFKRTKCSKKQHRLCIVCPECGKATDRLPQHLRDSHHILGEENAELTRRSRDDFFKSQKRYLKEKHLIDSNVLTNFLGPKIKDKTIKKAVLGLLEYAGVTVEEESEAKKLDKSTVPSGFKRKRCAERRPVAGLTNHLSYPFLRRPCSHTEFELTIEEIDDS